ncbi:hypothetical protein [Arcticibacter sp.]|uniref:hypothetical protein n=1 Tax=Arcticibacter sp. TaxID=1872630 RepID=UPI00388E368B
MNYPKTYTTFKSTLGKAFALLTLIALLAGCEKDGSQRSNDPLASGYSILVNNGNVLVSGFKSNNGAFSTKYWINGQSAEQSGYNALVKNQTIYRQAVDEQFRNAYTYKGRDGVIQNYSFDQGSGAEGGRIFYYKNNSMVRMGNDSIGTLTSVSFHDDKPTFAGSLGKMSPGVSGGLSYVPQTAFIWDGHSPLIELTLPEQSTLFWGVSTVFSNGFNEVYVGGLCGVPMYWQNTEPVVLDARFGEVWQITKSGSDIYAAGLINKYNSNSTGHTACYWKNGVLHELEDNAQAFGIFIDGEDIYVSGAVGGVPAKYRPCYWKNGTRVDLPM